ncbi:hypothetical protein CF327_g3967 [Tilletia walkeri]|nr:hypothetical protein CF327_g3967 [Tilletia walkeri]
MAAVAEQPATDATSAVLADRSVSNEERSHFHDDEFAKDFAHTDDLSPTDKEEDEVLHEVLLDFEGDLDQHPRGVVVKGGKGGDGSKGGAFNKGGAGGKGGAGSKGGKHPRDVFVKGGKGSAGSKGGAFNKGGAGSKGGKSGKHPREEATMVHGEDAV